MIKLGNIYASDFKLGSSQVNSVYLGSTKVWEKSAPVYNGLTLTSKQDGSTLTYSDRTSNTVSYSRDLVHWSYLDHNVTLTLNNGEFVYLRGKINGNQTYSDYNKFVMTGRFDASGNINSLVDYTSDWENITELPNYNYCLAGLFYSCDSLESAPELPATTLKLGCYSNMFHNCTSLEVPPELHATTLADSCYNSMFSGSGIINIPELPANTLASSCYSYMFQYCNNLTSIELFKDNHTTLSNYCCSNMFSNCESLTSAYIGSFWHNYANGMFSQMFADSLNLNEIIYESRYVGSSNDYYYWVSGVAATGDFYNLSGNQFLRGESGIPEDWIEHTEL